MNTHPQKKMLDYLGISESDFHAPFEEMAHRLRLSLNAPIIMVSFVNGVLPSFTFNTHISPQEMPGYRPLWTEMVANASEDALVVHDAATDARLKGSVETSSMPSSGAIRFYAAAPIIVPDGLILGAVWVADHVPRPVFSQQDRAAVKQAAYEVGQLILKKAGVIAPA